MPSLSLRIHTLLILVTFIAFTTPELTNLHASLPGHPLDLQPINAQGQAFYTGISGPSTYCPEVVEPHCPNATNITTIFAGMTALWVNVPGGQQVYTSPEGALGFTQAHSAFIPTGSYTGGWKNVTVSSSYGRSILVFTWEAPDKSTRGVLACPKALATAKTKATYQIYARTPAFNKTGCVVLNGLHPSFLPNDAPFGAWQYI